MSGSEAIVLHLGNQQQYAYRSLTLTSYLVVGVTALRVSLGVQVLGLTPTTQARASSLRLELASLKQSGRGPATGGPKEPDRGASRGEMTTPCICPGLTLIVHPRTEAMFF